MNKENYTVGTRYSPSNYDSEKQISIVLCLRILYNIVAFRIPTLSRFRGIRVVSLFYVFAHADVSCTCNVRGPSSTAVPSVYSREASRRVGRSISFFRFGRRSRPPVFGTERKRTIEKTKTGKICPNRRPRRETDGRVESPSSSPCRPDPARVHQSRADVTSDLITLPPPPSPAHGRKLSRSHASARADVYKNVISHYKVVWTRRRTRTTFENITITIIIERR